MAGVYGRLVSPFPAVKAISPYRGFGAPAGQGDLGPAAGYNRDTNLYLGSGPKLANPGLALPDGGQPAKAPPAPVAPAPAVSPPVKPPAPNTGGHDFGNLDFSGDPILAQVRAYNARVVANAQAGALAAKKRDLIDFGSKDLATQTIGDTNTATAAAQNPFSTLAQLLGAHDRNDLGVNETRNKQNLFYSSTRGNDLTTEGKDYLLRQATAQGALERALTGYDSQVLQAQDSAAQNELSAEEAAYMRAIQFALANGGYGDSGGGGGSGDSGDPGAEKKPTDQEQPAPPAPKPAPPQAKPRPAPPVNQYHFPAPTRPRPVARGTTHK